MLGVEPIRSPSLRHFPVLSLARNHGYDPTTTGMLSNGLGVVGCIGHDLRWPCDRSPPRSRNPTFGERWLIGRRIMDIHRYDHTGDRRAIPFDEEADLRTANASVPVIADQSSVFAGIAVESIARFDRSRSERSYPSCRIAAKISS